MTPHPPTVPMFSPRWKALKALRAARLGVRKDYLPEYRHTWYRTNGYSDASCTEADAFCERCVSLPFYPRMDDRDFESALERTRRVWKEVRG